MQRRKELCWFAVRRCHAGYGLYYLRIQPLYCRYVAGCPEPSKAIVYFILAIAGNSVGGMIVPLLKKLSNQPL